MRIQALSANITAPGAAIAVCGSGLYAQAVAALVGSVGNRVRLLGDAPAGNRACDIWTEARAHYTTAPEISAGSDFSFVKSLPVVLMAVPATEYGAMVEELAPHLSSGQVLFIVGAAFGAALQVQRLLFEKRTDLSMPIIEVSQPFSAADVDVRSIRIRGARQTLLVSGCSLNETRAGLSAGNGVFNELVPASNILERGFFDMQRWVDTASLLFAVLESRTEGAVVSVMSALKNELHQLAKAYRINRLPDFHAAGNALLAGNARVNLSERVMEDFVILSSLARLKYVPVPVLDSVIELASVVTATDLRKEGRQLCDLGLIGMDAQEIIEHVSA